MRLLVVDVPSVQNPIAESPGFAKKLLSDYKLDSLGCCEFGCHYCSSNWGNYLRINRQRFADLAEVQIGQRLYPSDEPRLTFHWPDFGKKLTAQLAKKPSDWGRGMTLVYSMLTDGFSPSLVKDGITEATLRAVLERTEFRIRVLTKNAIVGTPKWIEFFRKHSDRFVVGLSIGSTDDKWAKQVERFTPPPSRRLDVLNDLQDAGIPTYGMLCPVFPDAMESNKLEELIDRIRPEMVEHVWAEPFNDRKNWPQVRNGYAPGSVGYKWLTAVYEDGKKYLWSEYATELYVRLRDKARREGWLHKLRYLLYEDAITEKDAKAFRGLKGVLLQSKPAENGKSRNPYIAALQSRQPPV
jgi:DNA repair photolyase